MSYKTFFITLFFLFCLASYPVYAHSGGGPPFLKINGKFAQTNPYFQQEIMLLTIPQDVSPDSYYLVGKTISFVIDREQLTKQTTIPSESVDDITFRWSIATGENFENLDPKTYSGYSFSHIFNKVGSYLLIVEAKSPLDDNYVIIDTVKLDVLSSTQYKIPSASVFVGLQGSTFERPVLFVSQAITDPSSSITKYLWDFHENSLFNGISVEKRFTAMSPYNTRTIYHRVVDSNGLIADVAFAVENYQGNMQFVPLSSLQKTIPVTIGTYNQAKSKIPGQQQIPTAVIIWGIIMTVGIVLLVIFFAIVARGRRVKK